MPRRNAQKKTRDRVSAAKATVQKEVAQSQAAYQKNKNAYKTWGGVIAIIIGLVLIVWNLQGVLLALVGFILLYVGLRVLGYRLPLPTVS
ncbi:MAG: hypothetical protein KGH59_04065 [Candidatus Micrarchaeota archaeon]|nr:hypothetical protein [Candidatus Micrarchaeota archaeon]MDE1804927.1 hypothetical protein [Candidatus Micrarchaeota archaeon]MDE1846574.1 hypothetical protein [Candidatus Micrarchaeota archaeon]